MKVRIDSKNGITLIALIITIIVLLILAGVTINTIFGENGIIQKTNNAKLEQEKSEIKEIVSLSVTNITIENKQKQDDIYGYYEEQNNFIEKGQIDTNTYPINEYIFSKESNIVEFKIYKKTGTKNLYKCEIKIKTGEVKINQDGITTDDDDKTIGNIVYVLNGGKFETSEIVNYEPGKIVGLSIPVKDGYVFDGWYLNENFSGEALYRTTAQMKGKITIYAKWLQETNSDYFDYETSNSKEKIIGFSETGEAAYNNGEITTLVIPKKHNNVEIYGIGQSAFNDRIMVKKLVLQDNITLSQWSFAGDIGIEELMIPISLNLVDNGYSAFEACNAITKVTFFKGTGYGFDYSENDYKLTPWYYSRGNNIQVRFEDDIKTIGSYMFMECTGLQMVELPKSLEEIHTSAFQSCTGMVGQLNIPEGVTKLEQQAFYKCSGINGTLQFPSTLKQINPSVFADNTSVEKLIIHDGITNISRFSFAGDTGIKEIVMPISLNSVADIGSAFEICNAVTKITFTKGTGNGFEYNSNDGSNYRLTPWYNSRNNNIQVKFEEGVKSIGSYMFMECTGLQMVELPKSLEEIHTSAFQSCTGMVGQLNIPEGVTKLEQQAFYKCSGINGTLQFPSTLKQINPSVFADNTSVEKLIIHDGITNISRFSFAGDTGIKEIVMPISLNSVADIGSAFEICNAVTKVTFTKGTGEGFEYNSNDGSNYRLTPWYNSRENKIEIVLERGIKSIGTNTFIDLQNAIFYYRGSESEWESVSINANNNSLINMNYNYNE